VKNPIKYLGNELKYLEEVLNTDKWSSTEGSWTGRLERAFSKKFKTNHAIGFNSGTSTLHAALIAVGVKPGDEVISPALSVIMNTSSTIHANAIPVYADILSDKFTIDPEDIERKITPKTKAIMIVSVYGLPCEMDEIMYISKKHGIPIIEDNAECFLSKYKGKMVGTFGDMSSYSFENSKHMSCGEGGMLITNNMEYAELSRKVGNHGYHSSKADDGRVKLTLDKLQNPNYKRHSEIGWNYRLSEFDSAIALAQLERLDELVELRKESTKFFLDVISDCNYLIPQQTPDYSDNSYFALAIRYEGESEIGVSWEDFRKEYIALGGDGFYGAWSVPYLELVMSERNFVKRLPEVYENIFYKKGLCPVAEDVQKKLMVFKTNYRDLKLAEYKSKVLEEVINKHK
tara:strand:+ start:105 stop:1310 length:1206 start_codon:yes stop_codon:yes gene_type:complete